MQRTTAHVGTRLGARRRSTAQARTVRDPERAAAAHLLRRATMAAHPDQVDDLAGRSWNDAVGRVLDVGDAGNEEVPAGENWPDVVEWWLGRMTAPDSGLVDRMAWFWHGLLTTNAEKVELPSLVADQLRHLRTNALGNYRALLQGFVAGGALLLYLDASDSIASNPNENLARELMELFTIGRGNYGQDDVRAAARALAGWVVEDGGAVEFRRDQAFIAPLIFLDEQAEWDSASIVDRLCDHPATAERVASRLWRHLIGRPPTGDAGAELGRWWTGQDLEIRPLVERILTDPALEQSRLNRPRTGLEWYTSARAATGFAIGDLWFLDRLGQHPYQPPNVAGWPEDDRWLSAGSLMARSVIAYDADLAKAAPGEPGSADDVDEILDRCGLFEVAPATIDALYRVEETEYLEADSARLARWRLALTCPEFHLS